MGVRKGVEMVVRPSFWNLGLRTKICSKPGVTSLIPIELI